MKGSRDFHEEGNVWRFFDPVGNEVKSVTRQVMKKIDQIAMEKTGPNLHQMMENAGRTVASFVLGPLSRIRKRNRILVLAGPGGNGGGGVCAARHLANHGLEVSVAFAETEPLKPIVCDQLHIFHATSGTVVDSMEWDPDAFDLIIDALLGYSLKGSPTLPFTAMIRRAKTGKTPVLALDIPSGVDATTGKTPGAFLPARWTLTLALPKKGLSPQTSGRIYLVDLGIPAETFYQSGVRFPPYFGKQYWLPLTCRKSP
ncbi:MAG: NAD(P)H-hydrate epimerase [Leptospirales bacterium]